MEANQPPLIPDVLPRGLTVLYGAPDAGLRHTAVDWARTVAWSGHTALYAAGEGAVSVRAVRRSWDASFLTGDDVKFQMLPPSHVDGSFPDLTDVASVAWLSRLLRIVDPDLLVVDPLDAASGGAGVRTDDVAGRIAATARGLHARRGISTLLVHHDDELPRALRDAAESIWFAFASEARDHLSLVSRKATRLGAYRRLNFRLRQVGLEAVAVPSLVEVLDEWVEGVTHG